MLGHKSTSSIRLGMKNLGFKKLGSKSTKSTNKKTSNIDQNEKVKQSDLEKYQHS
jgi:hypothetical protein